jgi:hypothetical protein
VSFPLSNILLASNGPDGRGDMWGAESTYLPSGSATEEVHPYDEGMPQAERSLPLADRTVPGGGVSPTRAPAGGASRGVYYSSPSSVTGAPYGQSKPYVQYNPYNPSYVAATSAAATGAGGSPSRGPIGGVNSYFMSGNGARPQSYAAAAAGGTGVNAAPTNYGVINGATTVAPQQAGARSITRSAAPVIFSSSTKLSATSSGPVKCAITRALFIGTNYTGQKGLELKGCVNDVSNSIAALRELGFDGREEDNM